ncbi:MAG: hypothetical protein H0W84_13830, partial [Bacteroidetes bacterium]|nr:hypothetical protein [Bacteroidota bacterium]
MKNILYYLSYTLVFTILFVSEAFAQTSCATAVNITVKSKNVDCFVSYTPVMTSDIGTAYVPTGTCATSGDDDWWGKFTATATKTEFYLWGKG